MSRWLRDRVCVWISPTRVVAASGPGLLRRSAPLQTLFDETLAATETAAARWGQGLQVLQRRASGWGRRTRIDVALSDHFVRYLVLPWREGLAHADWEAYAQHEFERVYGRADTRRRVRIAAARAGRARVAAAVDGALVEGLQAFASSARANIGAIESNLCRIVGRCDRHLAGDGHLFVAEPGRLTRLSLVERAWDDVQSVRCGSAVGEGVARMLRELECAPGSTGPGAATVWYWGYARANDMPGVSRAGRFVALPLVSSLPPQCANLGMI